VTKNPVCVLGLGLIGGSVLRAAVAAGREALGYNRSALGSQAAESDGFAATTDLSEALAWAASRDALIVLAVPMPAVEGLLPRVKQLADNCPLTDVISVKGAVLGLVGAAGLLDRYVGGHPMAGTAHSGWQAGDAALFRDAPWVVSVDAHVDAAVFSQVMHLALDCGAVVVPAKSGEHDTAVLFIHDQTFRAQAFEHARDTGLGNSQIGRNVNGPRVSLPLDQMEDLLQIILRGDGGWRYLRHVPVSAKPLSLASGKK
jgi:prephenate dehydrogenase